MAKLDEAKSKRDAESESPEAVFGVVALDPFLRASNRLLEGWVALSSEMLEFGRNRFDRSVEMGKAIAQSTSLEEAIDLQTTYARAIVEEFVSEAQKIADLGARSLVDSLATLQQRGGDKPMRETSLQVAAE